MKILPKQFFLSIPRKTNIFDFYIFTNIPIKLLYVTCSITMIKSYNDGYKIILSCYRQDTCIDDRSLTYTRLSIYNRICIVEDSLCEVGNFSITTIYYLVFFI